MCIKRTVSATDTPTLLHSLSAWCATVVLSNAPADSIMIWPVPVSLDKVLPASDCNEARMQKVQEPSESLNIRPLYLHKRRMYQMRPTFSESSYVPVNARVTGKPTIVLTLIGSLGYIRIYR